MSTCRLSQCDGRSGRSTEGYEWLDVIQPHKAGIASGAHEVHDVVHNFLIHIQAADRVARGKDVCGIEQSLNFNLLTSAHSEYDVLLLVTGGIAYPHLQHEPVELRLWQRI